MSKPIPHGTLSGYSSYGCRCEECRSAYRAYRAANAERIRSRMATYYVANKEHIDARNKAYYVANREAQLAASKRRQQARPEINRAAQARYRAKHPGNPWRKANPDRDRKNARRYSQRPDVKAYRSAWIKANAHRVPEYNAKWLRLHPEKARLRSHQSRVRRLAVERFLVSESDWLQLCRRFGERCAYCGDVAKLTIDHVVPITRGGRHSIGNLLPACRSCNASKNNRFLVEWRGRHK